jgi:Na+/proline symporter
LSLVVVCILIYVSAQLLIGFWVSRGIRTEADYLLAGRNLGPTLTLFTVFATWYGAETCVGAAGQAYEGGLAAVTTDPFGYALGIFAVGLLVAYPLWRRQLLTLADLFRQRYGVGVERLAAVLMIPTSLLWAAAQIRAFGQVLAASSEMEVLFAVTVAAAVVIVYTTLGGMLADAISDLIQGIVLIIGMLVVGAIVGFNGGFEAVGQLPREKLTLVSADTPWLATLEAWAVPVLGTICAQEMLSRIMSARSPTIARNATIGASFIYLSMGLIPVTIGLIAPVLQASPDEPDQVLMHVAQQNLPTVLYVIFVGALVSAILSTVNSALLVAGSLTAHNLVLPLKPNLDEAHKVLFNRVAVVVFGLIAYVMALMADDVYALVEEASSLGSAGVLICMLFALAKWRVGGALCAAAALITGLVVYVTGSHVLETDYPYITSVAAALAAYLVMVPFSKAGAQRA